MSLENFESKLEPDYSQEDTQPAPCHLVIFGVDFMTNASIKDYFLNFDSRVQKINWIDDSNCRVQFATPEATRKALETHLRHPLAKNVDS